MSAAGNAALSLPEIEQMCGVFFAAPPAGTGVAAQHAWSRPAKREPLARPPLSMSPLTPLSRLAEAAASGEGCQRFHRVSAIPPPWVAADWPVRSPPSPAKLSRTHSAASRLLLVPADAQVVDSPTPASWPIIPTERMVLDLARLRVAWLLLRQTQARVSSCSPASAVCSAPVDPKRKPRSQHHTLRLRR